MTTRIDISAAQFAEDTTFQTADSKTIRVKHFCVEESETPKRKEACLGILQIGQKVRTGRGDVLSLKEVNSESSWPYVFTTESGSQESYRTEGWYWDESDPDERDIVEILPHEVPLVALGNLPIGSTFRTRNGLVCTLEKSQVSTCGPLFGRPPNTDPGGLYYDVDGSCRKGNMYDAVEILTCRKPRVSIKDAKKGDTFALRSGKKYVFTGERGLVASEGYDNLKAGLVGGAPYDCLWFQPDGVCPNRDDGHEVVELIAAPREPRVSIEGAVKGDRFRIRDGRVYTCTGEKVEKGRFRTTDKNGASGLTFNPDGSAPVLPDYADVVEIIPAPVPSLADRVFAQVSKVDKDAIDEVIISTRDYTNHYGAVKARIRELGSFRLIHSSKIDSGAFEILFKGVA